MRWTAVAIVVLAVGPGAGSAAAQVPPRDRPSPVQRTGTAVIRGRVIDGQTGTALPRARVRLMGAALGGPPRVARTDDNGRFEFPSLPAGSFTLAAEKPTYLPHRFPDSGQPTIRGQMRQLTLAEGENADQVVIPLYHGGAIVGRVVDAHGDPVEYAQITVLRVLRGGRPQSRFGSATNDLGEYRIARLEPGQYLLLAAPQRGMAMGRIDGEPADPSPQPIPTYFPGVPSLGQAQPIAIERGSTVTADIQLADGQLLQVSGTVVDSKLKPIEGGAGLSFRPVIDAENVSAPIGNAMVRGDGSFQAQLPPGEYELEAHLPQRTIDGVRQPTEGALMRLAVGGEVTGVVVQTGPGAKVSGRIVFEGGSPLPAPPSSGAAMPIVSFDSAAGRRCIAEQLQISSDWTFTIAGLFGMCAVRSFGGLQMWTPKSITYNGTDLLDRTLIFEQGQEMRGVEVVLTDRRTELTLHVVDEHGAPTREYVALVFPTDAQKWSDANGRLVRPFVPPPDPPAPSRGTTPGGGASSASPGGAPAPAANRRETMSGMPAGDYYVIAVDDVEVESFRDPALLRELSRSAVRVSLEAGSPAELNLRRVPLARSNDRR